MQKLENQILKEFQGAVFSGVYVVRDATKPFAESEILRWLDAAGAIAKRLNSTKISTSS